MHIDSKKSKKSVNCFQSNSLIFHTILPSPIPAKQLPFLNCQIISFCTWQLLTHLLSIHDYAGTLKDHDPISIRYSECKAFSHIISI